MEVWAVFRGGTVTTGPITGGTVTKVAACGTTSDFRTTTVSVLVLRGTIVNESPGLGLGFVMLEMLNFCSPGTPAGLGLSVTPAGAGFSVTPAGVGLTDTGEILTEPGWLEIGTNVAWPLPVVTVR